MVVSVDGRVCLALCVVLARMGNAGLVYEFEAGFAWDAKLVLFTFFIPAFLLMTVRS